MNDELRPKRVNSGDYIQLPDGTKRRSLIFGVSAEGPTLSAAFPAEAIRKSGIAPGSIVFCFRRTVNPHRIDSPIEERRVVAIENDLLGNGLMVTSVPKDTKMPFLRADPRNEP